MKLTREHKILLGILGAGVLALGVDRFVLSAPQTQPQSAAAAVSPTVSASASHAAAAAEPVAAVVPALPGEAGVPMIAEKLRGVQDRRPELAHDARDAFVAAPGWLTAPALKPAVIAPAEARSDKVEQFLKAHTLSAVMNNRIALVNGTPYRVGDSVGEAVIVGLDRGVATLRLGQTTFDLSLQDEGR